MEEQRENKIGSVLAWLQAGARGKASRMQFKKLQDQVSNPSEHGSLFIFFSTEIGVVLLPESSPRLYAGKNLEVAPDLDAHQVGDFLLDFSSYENFSRPNLKCTQFGKYKKEYEEKIAIAEANIDEAVRQCSAVVEVHAKLSAEKNELVMALQSGGSAVQVDFHH